jgi:hypothetical protein
VWTPKRILLLTLGFIGFLTAYLAYGRVLGRIDGLPPLPEIYWPPDQPTPDLVLSDDLPVSPLETKLQQAFSRDCPELKWPIKLEVRSRGMVLAAQKFQLDGHNVTLTPLSVAIFSKTTGNAFPEISTIQCKEALLKFDGPVTNPLEMGKRKVLAAELRKDVRISNNRHTPQRDDDITLRVPGDTATVHYEELGHHIWTKDAIDIHDEQCQPKPMVVQGIGMDVILTPEQPTARVEQAPRRKARKEGVSGVDRVVLGSAVSMELYVDSHAVLPSGPKDKSDSKPAASADPKAAEEASQPEKAEVRITTAGPFHYDVGKDLAWFDVPPSDAPGKSNLPDYVEVTRLHKDTPDVDRLQCEHLELQFHRKEQTAAPPAGQEQRPMDRLEIETCHATGKEVILTSEPENFAAHGSDFLYEARTKRSTLKSHSEDPVWAMKDGNLINARELQIINARDGAQLTAFGPGEIRALDKDNGARPIEASWKERLVSSRDDAGFDVLVLTGEAAFADPKTDPPQRLTADTLKVWLKPSQSQIRSPTSTAEKASAEHQNRLHRVEGVGHVACRSPDLTSHDMERLIILFEDAPPGAVAPMGQGVGLRDSQSPAVDATPPGLPETKLGGPVPADPAARGPGSGDPRVVQPQEPRQKPMELQARVVEAIIVRYGSKSDLAKLFAEGSVHVSQEPSGPEDKGVDITGDRLQLNREPTGNVLIVWGDLARLVLNKVVIGGPSVNIDQGRSHVSVDGKGYMELESDKNFQGEKIDHPVPVQIFWEDRMTFDGLCPDFYGNVQAVQEQGNSRLLCQHLQATLDRHVSFKEGQKGAQSARVKYLVCSGDVHVEDMTFDVRGKLVKHQRIDCRELAVDNEQSTMMASGWGIVRILQPEGEQPDFAPPPATRQPGAGLSPPPPKEKDGLKLTWVKFYPRMSADNKKRLATFWGDVEVYNYPAKDLDATVDPIRLPQGAMHLRCNNRLDVLGKQVQQPGGRTGQEMSATGRVQIWGPDYKGIAETVSYNEAKGQVILDGGPGGQAMLARLKGAGVEPDKGYAEKYIYIPKTGELHVIGGDSIRGRN